MTRAVRRRLALAALACCTAAASGCGSSELSPELHPGSAAVVGDERITLDEVDDLADDWCEWRLANFALEEVPEEQREALPMAWMRGVSVAQLVDSHLLDLYLAEHDLEADRLPAIVGAGTDSVRDYSAQKREEVEATGVPDDVVDDIVDLLTGQVRYFAAAYAAGQADDGTLDDQGAVQRGLELIDSWRNEQEIEIDPRFGRPDPEAERFGYLPPEDTLSVLSGEPRASEGYFDSEYLEELPESQRCGTPPSSTS